MADKTQTKGDAVFVDLGGGRNLVALLAHIDDGKLDLDGTNYVALRAYGAAGGKRVAFNDMNRLTGSVPVKDALIPVLVTFTDPKIRGRRGGWRRTTWRRRWARDFACTNHGRGGAERRVAARFRRSAWRARDPRDRDEIAVVESAGQSGGQGAAGGGIADRDDRSKTGLHAKITMQARAGA